MHGLAWGVKQGVLMLAGPMDKETAQKAVQQAREYAVHAVHRAAKYAAAGGVSYQPPAGFELQTVFPTVGVPAGHLHHTQALSIWLPLS